MRHPPGHRRRLRHRRRRRRAAARPRRRAGAARPHASRGPHELRAAYAGARRRWSPTWPTRPRSRRWPRPACPTGSTPWCTSPAWSTSARSPTFRSPSWREQLDVNLVAPAVLTRACLPALRAARGTVVFVNSGAGLTAHPTWSAYAASKFGAARARRLAARRGAGARRPGHHGLPRAAPPRRCRRRCTSRRARSTTRAHWIQPGDGGRRDPARARPAARRDDPRASRSGRYLA